MKKLITSILAGCVLSFGIKTFAGPAEDMLAAAQPTIEGLVEMADKANNKPADEKNKKPTLDPVAYEALILAHKDAKPDPASFFRLDAKAPSVKALSQIRSKYNLPSSDVFIDRLLANPSPSVRAKAVTLLGGSLFGTTAAHRAKVKELIAKETDDAVIGTIVSTFANDGAKEPEIGAFLVKCLSSENPAVRRAVVVFSTSSWNFKTPGLSEKIAELILTEKDAKVRNDFLERAGSLGKDVIFESYNKVLDGTEAADIKAKALSGLLKMWWSFPLYNTYNEKAYRKTLAYIPLIKDEAVNKKLFYVLGSALGQKASSVRTLDEYAKNAPWYKGDEVRKVILPLVDYTNMDTMTRAKLLKALNLHGAPKKEVAPLVQKRIDDPATKTFDKSQYERVLKELK